MQVKSHKRNEIYGMKWDGMEHNTRSIVCVFNNRMKQKYHSIVWKVNQIEWIITILFQFYPYI
jgi:hypothetical protein